MIIINDYQYLIAVMCLTMTGNSVNCQDKFHMECIITILLSMPQRSYYHHGIIIVQDYFINME